MKTTRLWVLLLTALLAPAGPVHAADKPVIRLGYVSGWSSNLASINVVATIIEKRLHYPVKTIALDAGPMWQGVAQGDLDAIVSAWLPTTHADYYNKFRSQVIHVGPNLTGARIGLVVPAYVPVDSIPELNQHAAKFRGRIIGIDPGAGIMRKTQMAIQDYHLDLRLLQSSGPAMTAQLARAIRRHHWVVVTGWTPHWMWNKWKLKYLDDPKNVYGKGDHIDTVVARSLPSRAPEVYAFLKRFRWSDRQMNEVMLMIRDGVKPQQAAARWIDAHDGEVREWLGQQKPSSQISK